MRYHLESTLPIHAFRPVGGRHNPFKHGMTLEGGGGGGIISAITDPISDVLGTSGDGGGILGALADVDKAVGDVVPGGWGTIAAVAVPYAAPYLTGAALTAGQAAALAAGTSAATGAIQGKELDDILKNAALAGAASYGLNSLFSGAEGMPNWDADITAGAEGYANAGANAAAGSVPSYVPDEASPYIDGTPPSYPDASYEGSPYVDGTPPQPVPPELDLNALYQDLPDTGTRLGYDQTPEIAASISSNPTLEEELKKEAFFKELINNPKSTYTPEGVQFYDQYTIASPETEKMVQTGMLDRLGQLPGAAYDMAKSYVVNNPYTSAAIGLGALTLAGAGDRPEAPSETAPQARSTRYTGGYGSAGRTDDPYLLRNRVTSENIYDYRDPYYRYAKGGEVKHFAFGGISNALTRAFQPIEKAVLQPIGRAAPFVRDVAPYAGLLAAPFIASPVAAAGIGGLASGFGRPGSGFDMKRALMGGIAAYGASTLGAGLEAAGTTPDLSAPNWDVDITASSQGASASKPFFRSPETVFKGIGNLVDPSTYDQAATRFGTQAGTFKTGVPLVIGTTGMMAVDEAQKMKEEADLAAAASRGEQQEMLARIAKGRKRAEQAVRENPYMYAEGGPVPGIASQLGGSMSKFEPGNGPPPGMTWSETQGKFMPSSSVVGAMPSGNMPLPQQAPYMPIVGNQGMRLNQREYEIANPDKPTDLDYKSGSPTSNLPPGFIPPDGPATMALEDFYNPQTKQRVTVGSGGYTPPPGFYNVTGIPVNRYPTPTVRAPDAATGYRPPPISPNQFLIERMINSRNIYNSPVPQAQVRRPIIQSQFTQGQTPYVDRFTNNQRMGFFTSPEFEAVKDLPSPYKYKTGPVLPPPIQNQPVSPSTGIKLDPDKLARARAMSNTPDPTDMAFKNYLQRIERQPLPNQYLLRSSIPPSSNPFAGGLRALAQRPVLPGRRFAMGGSVEDELGGDYSAMGMDQGNLQRGLFGMGYKEGGSVSKKEKQDFLDMINFEARTMPPARNIEGVGFVNPPPAVQGRLGANIDALGGNVRAGASGMAMMGPDGKIMTAPGMVDVGYRSRVGPGELDIGLQRAIRSMPGRDKDYAVNANYRIPFAEGGQPRFLSGGGDGMSDSIPATIEGKQEARLADGEFVIPADVVSHLGNGSSKAGAKQLYSMMDRVRKARTGNQSQGRQINPKKMMPA